jgi:signal recognition particle GTPase
MVPDDDVGAACARSASRLSEADVALPVVRDLSPRCAKGARAWVPRSVTPAQMVAKIVHDHPSGAGRRLTAAVGDRSQRPVPGRHHAVGLRSG